MNAVGDRNGSHGVAFRLASDVLAIDCVVWMHAGSHSSPRFVSCVLPIVVLSDSLEVGEGATASAVVWRIRPKISELFYAV